MVFVAPDLEFARRRVIAESAVALHRCALRGTFEGESGAGGAPFALDGVFASFLLLPTIFDEVLLGRQGERQAATTVGSSGCQISDGRRTIGIDDAVGPFKARFYDRIRRMITASHVCEFIDPGRSRVNAWSRRDSGSRLMLNTFHVRRSKEEAECQKAAADSARTAGRHDDRGRNSRTQTLLSICQRQRESSTSLPRAMFDTAIQRDPTFSSMIFVNERNLLANATLSVHQRLGSRYSELSRHSTEKKKERNTTTSGCVISPPSHLVGRTEIPRGCISSLEAVPPSESFSARRNEFRRASKGARSARKAHVVEFNLHVSGNCDQPVRSADARSRAFSSRALYSMCEN